MAERHYPSFSDANKCACGKAVGHDTKNEGYDQSGHLLGIIRALELNVDGLNTQGFQQKKETQAALDRIKALCRETLKK